VLQAGAIFANERKKAKSKESVVSPVKTTNLVIAGLVATAFSGIGAAHHSFAMFDPTKEIVLTGVVKEFQWTNPHTFVQLEVPGPDGTSIEWSIEGSSPNGLARIGWKRTSIKAGDQLDVTINPLRSGEHGGNFVQAKFADGRILTRRAGEAPAEGAPK
jgi:hypothetical protein